MSSDNQFMKFSILKCLESYFLMSALKTRKTKSFHEQILAAKYASHSK